MGRTRFVRMPGKVDGRTRRKLRMSLGSRYNRRSGTKSGKVRLPKHLLSEKIIELLNGRSDK